MTSEGPAQSTKVRDAVRTESIQGGGVGASLCTSSNEQEPGREPHARRYQILRLVRQRGEVSIKDVLAHEYFRRFKHLKHSTLQDDFNIIATEFGRGLSIVRKGGVLKQAKVWESSFSKRGYVISNPDDPNELEDLKAKRRIADFVLADLLAGKSDEVIYLSTGTTVFQVALALVRSEMRGVSYIETDNAAVFELLCHESVDAAWTRHVGIRVLGGGVDLDHGDILGHVLHESPVDQFGKPRCSIAIIGVKAINRDTGELYSFRQSAAKAWVLNDLKQCEAIVPVTPDKIGSARGDPIYQPNLQGYGQRGKAPERRPIHIVTTQINQKDNEALKRHGYTVHEVLPPLRDAV